MSPPQETVSCAPGPHCAFVLVDSVNARDQIADEKPGGESDGGS
jgi:hypothetical protein